MCRTLVSAVPQSRALAPKVDFHPRHEVVLLCGTTRRAQASALAESLLALGFDALVLSGSLDELVEGLPAGAPHDGPALLVPFDSGVDTPVLRSRVRRSFEREHLWLDNVASATAAEKQREICTRLDQLERGGPDAPVDEPEEVSNVIQLPVTPKPQPPPPPQTEARGAPPAERTPSKLHYVLWPLVGAAVTALAIAAVRPTSDAPPTEDTSQARAAAPTTTRPDARTTPAPAPEPPAPVPVTAVPPVPSAPSAPAVGTEAEPTPEQEALTHDRVVATEDYLVFDAGEKARTWYAAMNVCRGRTHAGLDGWTTPSSRQLHALAKARVLPAAPLWSRTRSMREADVAFVVHGRAGTVQSANKSESISAAVCVRPRTEAEAS